jgi:ribosomal protein L9
MSKVWFVVALLILLLWVIPTMVSFYKKQKVYDKKIEELQVLDKREGVHSEAKVFHIGVFKKDAGRYFSTVEVDSIANNSYAVKIVMEKSQVQLFNAFLKKISLDYAVALEDNLLFKEINDSMSVKMVLKPY